MESGLPLFRSRVLSIQSHVVHGCVGNSAAVFPMQVNGVDVDTFNILSFSNHTGYALSRGYRVTPEQFQQVAEGLTKNRFIYGYDYVLSGYVGNGAVMEEIATFITAINAAVSTGCSDASNPVGTGPIYVCDPVCGDLGKLYVTQECVEVYRTKLLPLATLALPNGFEASILSGIDITCVAAATEAAKWFHTVPRVQTVIIKSFRDKERDPEEKFIFMLVSEATYSSDDTGGTSNTIVSTKQCLLSVEYINGYFTGTGDAFGGLFMAHYTRAQHAKKEGHASYRTTAECAAAAATATLGVLKRTQAYRLATTGQALKDAARGQADSADFDARELMLIHSADILKGDTIGVGMEAL